MKRIKVVFFLFTLLIYWNQVVYSQTARIDSLNGLLQSEDIDSVRVRILNSLARLSIEISEYKEGNKYAQQAKELAEKINDKNGASMAYKAFGIISYFMGDYEQASGWYHKSLKLKREMRDEVGEADVLNNIGLVYNQQGKYDEALNNHYSASKIYKKKRIESKEADCYDNMGQAYEDKGDHSQALIHSLLALKIRIKKGDAEKIARTHNAIANIYDAVKNYNTALKHQLAALDKVVSQKQRGVVLNDLGSIYTHMGNYVKAKQCYSDALVIRRNVHDSDGVAKTLNNFGVILLESADAKGALSYFQGALKIQEVIGDVRGIAVTSNSIGSALTNLGRLSEAATCFNRGLLLAKKIKDRETTKESYNGLITLDSLQDELDSAKLRQEMLIKDLDSLSIERPARIFRVLIWQDTLFQNEISFSNSYYAEEVNLSNVIFCKDSKFDQSYFSKSVYFYKCNFDGKVEFQQDTFPENLHVKSIFEEDVSFSKCKFWGEKSSFSGSGFNREANFSDDFFAGEAKFIKTQFNDISNFSGTIFSKRVIFEKAKFQKNVNFYQCKFGNYAEFSTLQLGDSSTLNFQSAILPDTINFEGSQKIPLLIDLTHADYSGKKMSFITGEALNPHLINLYHVDISKLRIPYKYYKLYFNPTITDDERTVVYEDLVENFNLLGMRESHKHADIEYQEFKWKKSIFSGLTFIPKYWWNFGYNKEYVFIWSFIFILIFTLFTFLKIDSLSQHVYAAENIPHFPPLKFTSMAIVKKGRDKQTTSLAKGNISGIRALGKRMWYSFVYTASIFFRLTLKIENLNFKSLGGALYILFVYVVGVVCLAYMANFVLNK